MLENVKYSNVRKLQQTNLEVGSKSTSKEFLQTVLQEVYS